MNFARRVQIAAQVVTATQNALPPALRALAARVPVHCERVPAEEIIHEGLEPDILGLFSGPAHGEEGEAGSPLPPQIFLYLDNLWDFAEGDTASFRAEVRLTYLHELGHYLGWDEDDLAARGLD